MVNELNELSKKKYDFVIVGSGLHSLILAYVLANKHHQHVALVERNDFIGDLDAPVSTNKTFLNSHFHSLTQNESALNNLTALNEFLNITSINENLIPLTIVSGKLLPFVGYGDRQFQAPEFLDPYLQEQKYQLSSTPSHWVDTLLTMYTGDVYTRAEVTSVDVQEKQGFQQLIINGSKILTANQLIYTDTPKSLMDVASLALKSNKKFQKLIKVKTFTCTRLHLKHSDWPIENKNYHVFFGNKDAFEPVLGRFFDQPYCQSLWVCHSPAHLDENSEHMGAVIKHIKKQIKRVYPELLKSTDNEKIVIETDSCGLNSLNVDFTEEFAGFKNFWVCHPIFSNDYGLEAKLDCAFRLLTTLSKKLPLPNKISEPETTSSNEIIQNQF